MTWVAVSDRLPDLGHAVLVRSEGAPEGDLWARRVVVRVPVVGPVEWRWSSPWPAATVGVTHWRDLPTGPEADAEAAELVGAIEAARADLLRAERRLAVAQKVYARAAGRRDDRDREYTALLDRARALAEGMGAAGASTGSRGRGATR